MFTVPESPSAVLALVPNPAGEAHTVASRGVALPVHTRLVAFLRLGEAVQPDNTEQEHRCEHQWAPATARAGAGPPCRPVHSPQKMAGLRQSLRCFGEGDSASWTLTCLCLADQRYSFPAGDVQCLLGLSSLVTRFPSFPWSRFPAPHRAAYWQPEVTTRQRKCATGRCGARGFKLVFCSDRNKWIKKLKF